MLIISDKQSAILKPIKVPTCSEVAYKAAWQWFQITVYVVVVVVSFYLGWTMGAVYG